MGKPMAVSLPFVLLLLDLWPLRRWPGEGNERARQAVRLVAEKVPLFILTFGVAALAIVVQKDIGALDVEDVLPLPWRLGNAALAVARYVMKAFVPVNLAFFYPHPGRNLHVTLAVLAAVGALLVSIFALREWRRRPWLTVGWFWFFVVLGPVLAVSSRLVTKPWRIAIRTLPSSGSLSTSFGKRLNGCAGRNCVMGPGLVCCGRMCRLWLFPGADVAFERQTSFSRQCAGGNSENYVAQIQSPAR